MSDFIAGSIATLLIDLHQNRPAECDFENPPMGYLEYLKSPEWKERSKEAKERAGYRCQICNSGKRLEVHHRTYERLGSELPEDLTVLCRLCHELYSKPT